MDYKEFLEYVIKNMVAHPDAVVITISKDDMGILATVDLDPEDMGKVIGKGGDTARSIRTVLHVIGMKNGARVSFKINEPPGGKNYGKQTY